MKTLKFKTNINCGGCIKAVTPHLDNAKNITRWDVDTTKPDKILTVEVDGTEASEVKRLVAIAGFVAEEVQL